MIEGASAGFSVVAGGAAPLAYQWQRNGLNLPGANASRYVTPPVTPADSGAQFRVIVTNAFGAVTSAWATLTVNPANTITWTGAVSSDWNNPTNWSPQTVPTASDRVVINAGNVLAPVGATFAVLDFAGGVLVANFANFGTLTWLNGMMFGAMSNAQGGVMNVMGTPGNDYFNFSGVLNNAGNLNWANIKPMKVGEAWGTVGGLYQGFNLNNTGTVNWSSTNAVSVHNSVAFNNAGVLRKTGPDTSYLAMPLTNIGIVEAQEGTLVFNSGYTQTAGSTILDGGSLSAGSPIYLNGGRLSGNGTVSAAVVNAAEFSPGGSLGTLTIAGSYTQTSAGTLNLELGGLTPGSQHDRLVVTGPVTLDGALQVAFTNGFVAGSGDFFNVLSYASRAGGFASSSPDLSGLGLTESYTSTGLVLIAGSNAFPSLTFTVSGGPTQTVCVPFGLQASAADVDGVVTNVTVRLSGSPLASASGPELATTAEIDFAGPYTFTASASDDRGVVSWATQDVAVLSWPMHWLLPAGFRTNGAFKLCMLGETGRVYQVLASTNLGATNWLPFGVMESTNGTWRWLDAEATNHPRRFYRAERLP